MIVGALSIYGGIEGVKRLVKNNEKPKPEQFINQPKTPVKTIAWNNVNCR